MNGFDPSALYSAVSGAGGVIAAALLLLSRSEKKMKAISETTVLEHQRDCSVGTRLRGETTVQSAELRVSIGELRGEVREGLLSMNLRLDRILERLSAGVK
jgi:hypothetical protein